MKVPTIQSQRNAPNSLGFREVQPSQVGDAISRFGSDLEKTFLQREERNANAMIQERMNTLREKNRQYVISAQSERRGKDVMGGPEQKSLYEDYTDFSTSTSEELLKGIPSKYRDKAKSMFDSVINGTKDNVARYQAGQEREYAQEVAVQTVNEISEDTRVAIHTGEDLDTVYQRARGQIKANNEGQFFTKEQIETQEDALLVETIMSANEAAPDEARAFMEKYKSELTAKQIATLDNAITNKRIQIVGDNLYGAGQGLEYADQIELIEASGEDDDAKKYAIEKVNADKRREDSVKTARSYGYLETLYDEIIIKNNAIGYTLESIKTNPQFSQMTMEHKNQVLRMFSGDKKVGQFDEMARFGLYAEARKRINSGEWTAADIQAQAGTMFDVRDATGLLKFAEGKHSGANSAMNVGTSFVQAAYPKQWKDRGPQIQYLMDRRIAEAQAMNKGMPLTQEEIENIADSIVKPLVETGWGIGTSQLKQNMLTSYPQAKEVPDINSTPIPYEVAYAYQMREDGYSDPRLIKSQGTITAVLGSRVGEENSLYFIEEGEIKRIFAGHPEFERLKNLR